MVDAIVESVAEFGQENIRGGNVAKWNTTVSPQKPDAENRAALGKKGADIMTFHDRARYERFNRKDSIVSIAEGITNESAATNLSETFESAQAAYDRIIILSDMQAWVGYSTPEDAFKRYCQRYN